MTIDLDLALKLKILPNKIGSLPKQGGKEKKNKLKHGILLLDEPLPALVEHPDFYARERAAAIAVGDAHWNLQCTNAGFRPWFNTIPSVGVSFSMVQGQ